VGALLELALEARERLEAESKSWRGAGLVEALITMDGKDDLFMLWGRHTQRRYGRQDDRNATCLLQRKNAIPACSCWLIERTIKSLSYVAIPDSGSYPNFTGF
jgi:hypothetical protein